MFWKRKSTEERGAKLPGPKAIPNLAGRHMVVEEKMEPDWVWQLKGVVRPTEKKKAYYCRVFSEAQAEQAGVKVRDWTSLDGRPDLILWEGRLDEQTNMTRSEKYMNPGNPPN